MVIQIEGKTGVMTLDESILIEDKIKELGFKYSIEHEVDIEAEPEQTMKIDEAVAEAVKNEQLRCIQRIAQHLKGTLAEVETVLSA